MSLAEYLHTALDSYLWCMDKNGIFCLSDALTDSAKIQEYQLNKWNGKTLNLNVGLGPYYPTEEILKAQYELFLDKVWKKKSKMEKEAAKKEAQAATAQRKQHAR